MKLVYFDDFKLGVVKDRNVVDVSAVVQDIPHMGPHDLMSRLIERFEEYRGRLEQAAEASPGVALDGVRLRSPLPKPGKLVCMAVNYMEDGTREAPAPINAFLKSTTSIIGSGDTVTLSKYEATVFEHEAELGLVIGKTATKVKAADWKDYVFGYLNFIDVSSRGLGSPPMDSFFPSKSPHGSAPMGPFLVTADEIPDPLNLKVQLSVSGDLRQNYHTSDMGHKPDECIEWASSITTLNPGDLLALGTNHRGLGPLQDGDTVIMEAEGLGKLEVHIKDDQKREWRRETRLQRTEREAAEASR